MKRALDADDTRIELGGREPSDERVVAAPIGSGEWRVVALFDTPPTDRDAKLAKLEALIAPFEPLVESASPPIHSAAGLAVARQRELDAQLDALAERAGARAALVFDDRSPVLWGSSAPRPADWDLDAIDRARALGDDIRAAGLDPAAWLAGSPPSEEELESAGVDETVAQRWSHRVGRVSASSPGIGAAEWREALQIGAAIRKVRAECRGGRVPDRIAWSDDGIGVFARGFARVYLLALVYDGAYSELHAEGSVVRALPYLETLVLALPPVEPPPKGAKVIAMRRP